MNDSGKLAKWVETQAKHGACRFVVRHAGVSGKTGIVVEVDASGGDMKAAQLAEELWEHATHDASGLGGSTQRYWLQALGLDGRARARTHLRVAGDDGSDEVIESSEPPSAQGLVAQAQRFAESTVRLLVLSTGKTIEQQGKMLATQAEQLERMQRERLESLGRIEDLISQRHMRELATEAEHRSQGRWDRLLQRADLWIPTAINHAAGKTVLPTAVQSPMELAISALFASLKPDQFSAIVATLDQDQQTIAFSLLDTARSKWEASQQQTPSGNGAAGADGSPKGTTS